MLKKYINGNNGAFVLEEITESVDEILRQNMVTIGVEIIRQLSANVLGSTAGPILADLACIATEMQLLATTAPFSRHCFLGRYVDNRLVFINGPLLNALARRAWGRFC